MVGSCNESSDCQTGGSSLAYCHPREKSKIKSHGMFKNIPQNITSEFPDILGLWDELHSGNAGSSTHWPRHHITDSVTGFTLICRSITLATV